MRRILFMLMLVLASTLAGATIKQDVIYLKNGEVVRGEIIGYDYQDFNTSVLIRTADGNVLTFQMDEVEMISWENGRKDDDIIGAQFGMRAGMNVSTFHGDYWDFYSRVGFHFGFIVDVPLYKDNLYFQPGLYFTQKGYKCKVEYEEYEEYYMEGGYTYTLEKVTYSGRTNKYYLEIPLLFSGRYTFGIAQLQVNIGPYVGFGVGCVYKYGEKLRNRNNGFKPDWGKGMLDVGLSMGAGVLLKHSYYIGFQYELGLRDTRDITRYIYTTGKPRNCMIGIGYNF